MLLRHTAIPGDGFDSTAILGGQAQGDHPAHTPNNIAQPTTFESGECVSALDFMNDRLCITHLLGDFDDVTVMRQVDCLATSADPLHQPARCTGAIFIEGLKDIVAKEG